MHASDIIRGMVFQREAEGDIRKVDNAKIAMFSCALDSATTETKVCFILIFLCVQVSVQRFFALQNFCNVTESFCPLLFLMRKKSAERERKVSHLVTLVLNSR